MHKNAELLLIQALALLNVAEFFSDVMAALDRIEGLCVGGHLHCAHVRHMMKESGNADFIIPENEFLFLDQGS